MRLPSRPRTALALALLAVAAAAVTLLYPQHRAMPKRFGVVEPGRLYRCGEISPAQLEHLAAEYHLRTVLSLLAPDAPESVAERQAAERLGLRWVNVPLPGNGASTAEERTRIKAVLFDLDAGPTLVHCAAGTNRTGLAVGMYRLHRHGWTLEQVLAEMRDFGFEDLPKHENLRQALEAEWQGAQPSQSTGSAATQPSQP